MLLSQLTSDTRTRLSSLAIQASILRGPTSPPGLSAEIRSLPRGRRLRKRSWVLGWFMLARCLGCRAQMLAQHQVWLKRCFVRCDEHLSPLISSKPGYSAQTGWALSHQLKAIREKHEVQEKEGIPPPDGPWMPAAASTPRSFPGFPAYWSALQILDAPAPQTHALVP